MNPPSAPATVIEALAASLEAASAGNPNDAEPPAAVLWTDRDSRWRPILPRLRALMPQLLVLGEYDPEERTGPAIWLRCVIDRALEAPGFPPDTTPIVYLPGAGRQELGVADACPDLLKPLVELQYRGACWTQRNGRDWTVEAFLTSRDGGGLGLDLARDAATRQSMQRALTALAAISVQALRGRRLEAEDFDRLFSDDPVRDVLVWLSDPEVARAGWEAGRWSAFASRCKADLGFDPEKDGGIVAAERLGRRGGPWGPVWRRFAEAPALYPGVPELLRKAMPDDQRDDLFAESSSWPQNNERDEAVLRRALLNLANEAPAAARERVAALEKAHGARRGWVWAKLDRAPLAHALASLAALASRASKELGGASVAEMARLYAGGAWETDAAALDSMAAVKSSADAQAVGAALNAIYRPWLESAARRLQALAETEPLPGSDAGGMPVSPQDTPLPGETAPASSSRGPSAPDLRSVAGGTPALPEHLDSRFRGSDGAEIAGTTKDSGTPASPQDTLLPGETPFPGKGRFPDDGAVPERAAVPEAAAREAPAFLRDDVRVEAGTVILFADGLRFDVSQRLVERLRAKGHAVAVSMRWAALPTVTATAKPAVSPVAECIKGLSLGEDFLPAVAESERSLTTDRFRRLLAAAGWQYVGTNETGDPSGYAWTEYGELDKLGHSLQAKLAARVGEQIALLRERIEAFLRAGWREVRVVTDHGWLWLPGGLPKVELPKYLTRSRWARCAAVEGGSTVETPTVPWHWNADERVAVGPGIACFGAGNEYAHGGLSLQESLVPVIRITAGTGAGAAKAEVRIAAHSWIGLRCRVRLDGVRPGLAVDLRTRVNDAASSVSAAARPVDDEGAASLLVPDDEHEGRPAAVVVLDAGGQVIARQSTIIGGED